MRILLFFILLFFVPCLWASTYQITIFEPSGGYFSSTYKNQLLSATNFGPTGTVKDVQFTINTVSSITDATLANTDILVMSFVYGCGWSISANDALKVSSFVNQGGSLILGADADSNAGPNMIAQYFGVQFASGWASTSGNSSIINHTIASELTDGPFGTVNSLTWSSNATSRINIAGQSTIIDQYGMVSVRNSVNGSGSVIFYADGDMSSDCYPGGADYSKLKLNIFAYSAHSVHTSTVPEPSIFLLCLMGLAGIVLCKKNNIE